MSGSMSEDKRDLYFKALNSPNYGSLHDKQHNLIQYLVRSHVDSFNFMLANTLQRSLESLPEHAFRTEYGQIISFNIKDIFIGNPTVSKSNVSGATQMLYPAECRQRRISYTGPLIVTLGWSIDGVKQEAIPKHLGDVPVMVKSNICNLKNLTPTELVQKGEEAEEAGGYFIINGIEKVVRLIVEVRKNHPLCIKQPSLKKGGELFTEYALKIRCQKPNGFSRELTFHYLSNGCVQVSFQFSKVYYIVPVMYLLKGLLDVSDNYIYDELLKGNEKNSFYKSCIIFMLRQLSNEDLLSQSSVLKYLGSKFRAMYNNPWLSDEIMGERLLSDYICIHLQSNVDKFNLLVYLVKKLYAFVRGECAADNRDSIINHEVLDAGRLYSLVLFDNLYKWLRSIQYEINKLLSSKSYTTITPDILNEAIRRRKTIVSYALNYLMATGNVSAQSSAPLWQKTGLCVIAERLNYHRFLSHFRAINRGSSLKKHSIAGVRKLYPESWGFICPVHTPDGAPCGLLNHLTIGCQIVNTLYDLSSFPELLGSLGVLSIGDKRDISYQEYYTVMLNGQILGYIHQDEAYVLCNKLRALKLDPSSKVPVTLEICFVPKTENVSLYPGVYLFSGVSRLVRPVLNLTWNKLEMIGTFEQIYLDIAVNADSIHDGITTHMELKEQNILSLLANLIPFSDFNQSPRNIYQCQMGKQTVGMTPYALSFRADQKLYRLQTPQSPIVRCEIYNDYQMDNYPLGTNVIVAVLSYTGYDMEDAMILNKGSVERGFSHGCIYKSINIDLKSREMENSNFIFNNMDEIPGLDADGLPPVGTHLEYSSPYYSYFNQETSQQHTVYYHEKEEAYVDQVKILGNDTGTGELTNVIIVLRVPRNPIIGDKFSSRHGQKGICSILWPSEDMPFTESGMTPDILFNPHGFPSRMTIGMILEFMAGKSGALHGMSHDSTPFSFNDDYTASDHFGKLLTAAGYNFYGTERLYSGVTGEELEADIFIGIVYYQKLRHMVSDKFQVRTTGRVDVQTHQPIKGRRRGGGARFGEMERDALIAHGSSFLLQDRLLNCTDRCLTKVCTECGNILSPIQSPVDSTKIAYDMQHWSCMLCKKSETIKNITIPYVFRYLVAELAAVNINLKVDVK
ncbi:DNA-directed RNA polymerase I subunit RPA2 isoform X1 [Octopus sinensis]|nr:DNA-directed RNA polymerase I subunit RPA2 isoform X1 [Octopus sinensis]